MQCGEVKFNATLNISYHHVFYVNPFYVIYLFIYFCSKSFVITFPDGLEINSWCDKPFQTVI